MPDFVIVDGVQHVTLAGEFKPPDQTKREYLTGVGQAAAYTRDFTYAALIVPDRANDGYRIADHILSVLQQDVVKTLPLALLCYDPSGSEKVGSTLTVLHPLSPRITPPTAPASIEDSFWAKWRDISPEEIGVFLGYLYEESLRSAPVSNSTPRDRAFARYLEDVDHGRVNNWAGDPRHITRNAKNDLAWRKNYTNFLNHIGWIEFDGKPTEEGLHAIQVIHRYGAGSRVFLDLLTLAVLGPGKHLVLINELERFQGTRFSQRGGFQDEQIWLTELEMFLEAEGLLKRNPQRHMANVRGSAREFLKAEKTLWKNLGLIRPRGGGRFVYHPERGFWFDWERITNLLSANSKA